MADPLPLLHWEPLVLVPLEGLAAQIWVSFTETILLKQGLKDRFGFLKSLLIEPVLAICMLSISGRESTWCHNIENGCLGVGAIQSSWSH